MKNWLTALVVITLFLSFVGFSNSFIMNSEIAKIQDKLVVIDRLNKDIVTDIALARMEFSQYMINFDKSADAGIQKLKDAAVKAEKVIAMTDNKDAKEKAAKIGELIKSNVDLSESLKKSGRDEVKYIKAINTKMALEKDTFIEITGLSYIIQKDIDDKIANIKLVSSKFVLISLFLLIFVAGGIVVTTIVYSFVSREQNEELNFYVTRNLIDRETGLFNKMYFLARLKELLNKAARFKEEVTLVMVNVEPETGKSHLKLASLRATGDAIKKGTRIYDIIGRFDNSVAVLLYHVGQKEVGGVLTRVKNQLEKNELFVEYQKRKLFFGSEKITEKIRVTVDFDIMAYPADEEKIEFLLKNGA